MKNDVKKLESKIQIYLSDIIFNDLNDDDLSNNTTISEVILTNDKLTAKIYVSFLLGDNIKLLERLNQQKNFIRSKLSKNLDKRKSPLIHFFLYNKLEKINEIENILNNIKER